MCSGISVFARGDSDAGRCRVTRPRIYIAAPYRHGAEWGVFDNIVHARAIAVFVLRCGGFPICPHLLTAFMGGVVDDAVFIENDIALMLKAADAVYAEGADRSEGVKAEVAAAREAGLPLIYDRVELRRWLELAPIVRDLPPGRPGHVDGSGAAC